MKSSLVTLASVILTFAASAQSLPQDSIPDLQLDEVIIQAPKVIRKADMDIYHPSKSAVEHSRNGLQLINNLMIPSLNVNDVLGTIQSAGQAVQIRINGRESSVEQLRTLLPETIKRIEWIDNPGLRYGGANAVLNVIVANPSVGGSLMISARPAFNEEFGFYSGNAKFNFGNSQIEVGARYKMADNIKSHRDYIEEFTFPDGKTLTRKEKSLSGKLDNSNANYWTSYNYIKTDTTVFIAELMMQQRIKDRVKYDGLLTLSDESDDILLSDISGSHGLTPTLSLYWSQSLPRKQMLIVDFSGSFYSGRSYSDYVENNLSTSWLLTDIHTNIRDRNQAYAFEANYIKNWRSSRFTAGALYSANRNRSQYENLGGEIFHQRQDKVYLFAEYFHRFGQWSVTAGMGAQYTDFLFKESNKGNHSWSPRPQATITYTLNQNHNFRLNFTSWQSTPSLAETNTVPQQLDGFQWLVGNQNLKTANSYMLTFRYGFNLPRIYGMFGVRAFTSPNAITPLLYWENDRLLTTYENSRGLQNLSFFFAPQIEIIPEWLMASCYVQFRAERMRGTGYSLTSNGWSGYAQIQLTHWGFVLSGQYNYAQRDLWGEKISWGEDINTIELSYNWKKWQFSAGIIMPFGRYDQGSKSLSQWNSNEQHMRLDMRIPYISISYNLQWGIKNATLKSFLRQWLLPINRP